MIERVGRGEMADVCAKLEGSGGEGLRWRGTES